MTVSRPVSAAPPILIALAVGYQWIYNGINFVAFKVSVDALPALVVAALRFSIAGLVLLPFAAWRIHRGQRVTVRQLLAAATIGFVMLIGSQTLAIWGVRDLPAGVASVFGSAPPLFLALFAWGWLRQPLGRRQLLGVLVGFAGLALMGLSSAGRGGFSPIGAGAVIASSAAWAAGSLLALRLKLPEDAIIALTAQLLPVGLILWGLAFVSGATGGLHFGAVPARAWCAVGFLVVASTLVGYAAFIWVNRVASSTLANTFAYVAPVISLGLSSVLLGETLSAGKILSACIALVGVALMVSASRSTQALPETA